MQHSTSHHISYRTIIHLKPRDSTTCQHTISHAHIPPCTSPHSNIKYTSHYPQHTFHTTPHIPHCILDHHSACLIGRQTIPHHSVLLPQPHFTSCISTPPHSPCTTPFHIASHHFTPDVARHHSITPLMSHIFYIAPYQSTSQPQGE